MNREIPDVQAGFRKGRGTRDQIANICWIIEKVSSRNTSTSALWTMPKSLTVWITINCGKFLKRSLVFPILLFSSISLHWSLRKAFLSLYLSYHASKVMLKILQTRLQQYVNRELPVVQAGIRKGRGTRDKIASIWWIIKKAREFQKNIYFCFIVCAKAFDCVDQNKLWKILKEMGVPDHLTCFLRNLYAGQEATVRTGHGTADWLQIGKGVCQGCTLSPCFFNLYAEYIMRTPGLEEAQAGELPGEISTTSDMQMTPPLW